MVVSQIDVIKADDLFKIECLETIDSTSEEIKRRLNKIPETPEYLVVWALNQTQGKGRRGKVWVSDEGNLFFSVLLRPQCLISYAAQINFVACLALRDALLPYKVDPQFKWPNDVMVDQAKIAGILLESDAGFDANVNWLIMGIGVNLKSSPSHAPYKTTSLYEASGTLYAPQKILEDFLIAFDKRYKNWQETGLSDLRDEWIKSSIYQKGDKITIQSDKPIIGYFEDLTEKGAILLRSIDKDKQLMTINAGDIVMSR